MKRKFVAFLCISVVFILCFPVFRNNVLFETKTITVTTLGSKSEASQGTEVWIDSIIEDGGVHAVGQLSMTDGWEDRGRIFSPGDGKYVLTFSVRYKKDAKIIFLRHPYSGKVAVSINKAQPDILDLYSSEEQLYEYNIQ